jgi:hypothetical protein
VVHLPLDTARLKECLHVVVRPRLFRANLRKEIAPVEFLTGLGGEHKERESKLLTSTGHVEQANPPWLIVNIEYRLFDNRLPVATLKIVPRKLDDAVCDLCGEPFASDYDPWCWCIFETYNAGPRRQLALRHGRHGGAPGAPMISIRQQRRLRGWLVG